MESNGSICLVTVDGTDCLINEPTPFNKKWCSHKFSHAALRYQVAVCIQTGWIVFVDGPYPAGMWPDLSISRDGLNQALEKGEMFVADGGYRDSHGWSRTPTGHNTREDYMYAVARARHETVNRLIKNFSAMRNQWRHHRRKHGIAFLAAANVVQARIQLEPSVYQVIYQDRLKHHLELVKKVKKNNRH